MQEKSEEKYSQANRLRRVQVLAQANWSVLAKEIQLSESMIYAVLAGKKELGPKSLHRLEILETAFGIEKPPQVGELGESRVEYRVNPAAKTFARVESAIDNLQVQLNELRSAVEEMKPSSPRTAGQQRVIDIVKAAHPKGRQ